MQYFVAIHIFLLNMKRNLYSYSSIPFDLFFIGGDDREIGRIRYLIGNKYDFYGDQESAVKYHTEYYELCKTINDDSGMGKACQALALANRRFNSLSSFCYVML